MKTNVTLSACYLTKPGSAAVCFTCATAGGGRQYLAVKGGLLSNHGEILALFQLKYHL